MYSVTVRLRARMNFIREFLTFNEVTERNNSLPDYILHLFTFFRGKKYFRILVLLYVHTVRLNDHKNLKKIFLR